MYDFGFGVVSLESFVVCVALFVACARAPRARERVAVCVCVFPFVPFRRVADRDGDAEHHVRDSGRGEGGGYTGGLASRVPSSAVVPRRAGVDVDVGVRDVVRARDYSVGVCAAEDGGLDVHCGGRARLGGGQGRRPRELFAGEESPSLVYK